MKRMTGNGIATGLAYYERLRDIEDILGDEYDLDLLQKQIQAYREGRYIILKEPDSADPRLPQRHPAGESEPKGSAQDIFEHLATVAGKREQAQ